MRRHLPPTLSACLDWYVLHQMDGNSNFPETVYGYCSGCQLPKSYDVYAVLKRWWRMSDALMPYLNSQFNNVIMQFCVAYAITTEPLRIQLNTIENGVRIAKWIESDVLCGLLAFKEYINQSCSVAWASVAILGHFNIWMANLNVRSKPEVNIVVINGFS